MKKLLWLDDYRNPMERDWLVFSPIPQPFETIWVKSYKEFVDWIDKNGLPDAICFDHDLAQEHYDVYHNTDFTLEEYYVTNDREMTGYDAAKWLVEYCLDRDLDLPSFNVQSANPAGKINIRGVLTHYNRFRLMNSNTAKVMENTEGAE